MVKEAIATGATTEEAYEKACTMLGVDPADAEFEVLETEEKKRFGLFGGRPAKVRAFIRSTPADAAAEYLRLPLPRGFQYLRRRGPCRKERCADILLRRLPVWNG